MELLIAILIYLGMLNPDEAATFEDTGEYSVERLMQQYEIPDEVLDGQDIIGIDETEN